MRTIHLRESAWLFFAVLLVLVTPAFAAPAPQRDPQALALLDQCATAMGARTPISDVRASGTMIAVLEGDSADAITITEKGYDRLRQDVTYSDHTDTSIFNKGEGWSGSGNASRPMADWISRYQRPDYFPALICTAEMAREDMSMVYVGLEQLNGVSVYHIKIFAAPRGKFKDVDNFEAEISEFHLYLDSQSLLPRASKHFIFSPAAAVNHSDWLTVYSDYRSVSGVQMPLKSECFLAGQKVYSVQFSEISINTNVPDSDFQKGN